MQKKKKKDDGGGMDPESLRRCMSFGFSDKKTESFIGQCKSLSVEPLTNLCICNWLFADNYVGINFGA